MKVINLMQQKTQQGATLFIGLLLLLAISIVSLAAMRTSILDLIIANNKQQFLNTFEASEQVLNQTVSDISLTISGTEQRGDIVQSSGTATTISTLNAAGDSVDIADVDTEIRYQNRGYALGWEMDAVAYHFQIDSEAESTGRGTTANHRAGFYIVSPGNSNN